MTSKLPEDVVQGWRDGIPLKRGGLPEDVAILAYFWHQIIKLYNWTSTQCRRRDVNKIKIMQKLPKIGLPVVLYLL